MSIQVTNLIAMTKDLTKQIEEGRAGLGSELGGGAVHHGGKMWWQEAAVHSVFTVGKVQ